MNLLVLGDRLLKGDLDLEQQQVKEVLVTPCIFPSQYLISQILYRFLEGLCLDSGFALPGSGDALRIDSMN